MTVLSFFFIACSDVQYFFVQSRPTACARSPEEEEEEEEREDNNRVEHYCTVGSYNIASIEKSLSFSSESNNEPASVCARDCACG